MVLSDRDIAVLIADNQLIDKTGYDPSCLTNIGYDLRAKEFAVHGEIRKTVSLRPGESAFVAAEECVNVPRDMLCRIALKNSRIRQGFTLDAPVYQPGHHTRVFFRLTNVSGDELLLESGEKYATILFEKLSTETDHPYQGAFRDEFDFSGLASYQEIYKKQIQEIERKQDDLKSMENSIYGNVLVILTVFVALFSFLTANLSLAAAAATTRHFLICNFVTLGCVAFLVALIGRILRPSNREARSLIIRWLPAAVCFAVALAVFFLA